MTGEAEGVAFPFPLPVNSAEGRPLGGPRLLLSRFLFVGGLPLAVDTGGFIDDDDAPSSLSASDPSKSWLVDGGGKANELGGRTSLVLEEDASDDTGRWATSAE